MTSPKAARAASAKADGDPQVERLGGELNPRIPQKSSSVTQTDGLEEAILAGAVSALRCRVCVVRQKAAPLVTVIDREPAPPVLALDPEAAVFYRVANTFDAIAGELEGGGAP